MIKIVVDISKKMSKTLVEDDEKKSDGIINKKSLTPLRN